MWIFGRQILEEYLKIGVTPRRLWIEQDNQSPQIHSIINRAKALGASLERVSEKTLKQITHGGSHQGVAMEVILPPAKTLKELLSEMESDPQSTLAILDEVQDPQNLGVILRSAACFGLKAVIIPEHRAVGLTGAVIRASSGATAHIPLVQVPNLNSVVAILKERGYFIYGADMEGAQSLGKCEFAKPCAIILGNEHSGMRESLRKKCDAIVRIEQFSGVSSLNVAQAATLFFYAATLDNSKKPKK